MRLRQSLLILLVVVFGGCGGEGSGAESGFGERPRSGVQQPAEPVRCPSAHPERRGSAGDFDARHLLGLAEAEARALAESNECVVRVVRRDGEGLDTTAELDFYRINVWVNDDVVTRIEDVG